MCGQYCPREKGENQIMFSAAQFPPDPDYERFSVKEADTEQCPSPGLLPPPGHRQPPVPRPPLLTCTRLHLLVAGDTAPLPDGCGLTREAFRVPPPGDFCSAPPAMTIPLPSALSPSVKRLPCWRHSFLVRELLEAGSPPGPPARVPRSSHPGGL